MLCINNPITSFEDIRNKVVFTLFKVSKTYLRPFSKTIFISKKLSTIFPSTTHVLQVKNYLSRISENYKK